MVLIDPTNLTPWPDLDPQPSMSGGNNGETGYLLRPSADGYAELARPAVVRSRRTVVISSTDGRWQRHPPRQDDLTWNPSTLAQIDRLWQGYQRDWVHRLNARHVIAADAATSCTATNPTSSPASSPTWSTPPAPGNPSTSTRALLPTAAGASCRESEDHTGSSPLLRESPRGHPVEAGVNVVGRVSCRASTAVTRHR